MENKSCTFNVPATWHIMVGELLNVWVAMVMGTLSNFICRNGRSNLKPPDLESSALPQSYAHHEALQPVKVGVIMIYQSRTNPILAYSNPSLYRRRPIRVRLYYDGLSHTACFSCASFANLCGWATDDLMADQVCHGFNWVCPQRTSPGISIFICGLKGVLTLLIIHNPRSMW